jgi:hypothetical protein
MSSPLSELLDHPKAKPVIWGSTLILLLISAFSIVRFVHGGPYITNDLGSDIKAHAQTGEELGKLLVGKKIAIILAPEQDNDSVAAASHKIQSALVEGLQKAGITDMKQLYLSPMPKFDPGNLDPENVWFSWKALMQFREQASDCDVLILPMGLPAFVGYENLSKLHPRGPQLVVIGGSDQQRDAIASALNRGTLLAAVIATENPKSYTVLSKATIDQ